MATTRRAVLGLLGATSVGATGVLAAQSGWSAADASTDSSTGRVPKGLRPGGELDQLITDEIAKDVFSGSLLITHRGRTVLARSGGWADRARSVPNGSDTLFGLASVAKMFVGVSVGQLAQSGKLRYEDTLGMHLDGFAADIADQVTIHQLLTHSSGLGDFMGVPGFWETARKWTSATQVTEGISRFIRTETLGFPPGAGNRYSNSGYHLLAEIVAKLSGQPYDAYIKNNIFRTAGMRTTDSYTLAQWREDRRIAHSYWRPPGSADRVDSLDEQLYLPGVFSTCAEMERFARALWGEKLLDPGYTRMMLSGKLPQSFPKPGPGSPPGPPGPPPIAFQAYGSGVTLSSGQWWYGHNGGATNGAAAELAFFPDSDYVMVILSNYEMEAVRPVTRLARRLILEG